VLERITVPEQKGESLLELMRRELELEEPPEGTVE